MKTICKSIIAIVLVSLMVFLLSFTVAQTQAQTSYIIVHAHNSEGVEIASIQGMGSYGVQIYDGNTFIGYGAHDAASHNQPITISPGSHTIKVKFNGMTLEQNVDLNPYETQILTFIFRRVEINNTELFTMQRSSSNTVVYDIQGYIGYWDCSSTNPPGLNSTRATASQRIPGIPAYLTLEIQASVSVSMSSFDIEGVATSSLIGGYNSFLFYFDFSAGGSIDKLISIPARSDFDNWYIQNNSNEVAEVESFLFQDPWGIRIDLIDFSETGYKIKTGNAKISYAGVRYNPPSWVRGTKQINQWAPAIGSASGSVSHRVTAENLKFSSVPYDLLGTGVKDGENQPPAVFFLDKENLSRQVKGAAADGASKVIIQIRNLPMDITPDKVQVYISSVGDGYLDNNAIISNGVFTQTWVPPEYFVRPGEAGDLKEGNREIKGLTISLYGRQIDHPKLYLIKPPVGLLHGMRDNMQTWFELWLRLITENGYQYISAYSYQSFDSFDKLYLVINKTTEDALGAAKKDGFAAKKADVVAHSMGGLLAKLYGRESNIRSITTVGTPHFGSPWADAVCDAVGCESDDQDLTDLQRLSDWFLKGILKIDGRKGAIKDLRVKGGNHCGVRNCIIDVPNYVISGIADPHSPLCWAGFLDVLLHVLKWSNPSAWAVPLPDLYRTLFGEERSDWVVSESSQKGFWVGDADDVTCHHTETKDKGVLDKIINYLHRTGSTASTVEAVSAKGQETQSPQYAIPPLQMGVSSGLVQITNPFEGQIFQIGDTVNVEISVSNENALVLIGASTGESALIDHPPYNFQFVIPNEVIGSLNIMVGAIDDTGFIGSDEVTINVASSSSLIDIKVYPEINPLSLDVGMSVPLAVYGLYDDGVTRNITSSGSGTSYTSSNPTIVEVSSEGDLTGKSQGVTTVTIGNSGMNKELSVICEVTNVFSDVPSGYWAEDYIIAIYNAQITRGCSQSPLKYCPEDNVTRGQMAAFIIRAKYGETFSYTTTPYFTDVPSTHTFFKYVQKLRDDGITVVSGTYGVGTYVTRGQMAAFIIRAIYGENFSYSQTPYFTDVPATHNFFKYVQKLRDDGITTVTGTYGVNNIVTRDQMAAFLARAFLGMQ